MTMHWIGRMGMTCLILAGSVAAGSAETNGETISFERTQLDPLFRSEGVAVADFNNDGKKDIAAGFVWYEAPDWKMHSILPEPPAYDPKGYSNSFVNDAEDLNGDGWVDLLVVDFPGTPTWWFENPGKNGGPWKRHEVTPVSNNESPQLVDLDGDGIREWVMGVAPDADQPDSPLRRMAFLTRSADPTARWKIHPLSQQDAPGTRRYDHGLGIGDINGDGRKDIVVPAGWWQCPEGSRDTIWQFHPAPLGEPAAQMHVYDFDGDGDNDVLSSSAHQYGIWWHEQQPDGQWKTHEIDSSFSQTHGLCLADINGDGLPDFVTGKRWWAHGGHDPGGNEPAVFYWFELVRENGKPRWIPHLFDRDSGPGTQFQVIDVDDDGLLDVAASNKKGVHLFRQQRN